MSSGVSLIQVVYCIERQRPTYEPPWWEDWYLLKCPLVCFRSLDEARRLIKEWKDQLGIAFQPVVIGETNGDFEGIHIANLFGVSSISGLDASEQEFPDSVLDDEGLYEWLK